MLTGINKLEVLKNEHIEEVKKTFAEEDKKYIEVYQDWSIGQ